MNVMVLGATGLTGAAVVEKLLDRPEVATVIAPIRRRIGAEHPKLIQQQVDFDDLEASADLFAVDAIICCLGTTIKKAGSREQFRKVDYEICLNAAAVGRKAGARAFILMSAIGASSASTIFYNRVKGELEDAVRALGYPYLSVYHPSLLLGERQEQRTAESLGIRLMPLVNRVLLGPMEKFRGVEATTVAQAMVNEVCALKPGAPNEPAHYLRDYPEIRKLAG